VREGRSTTKDERRKSLRKGQADLETREELIEDQETEITMMRTRRSEVNKESFGAEEGPSARSDSRRAKGHRGSGSREKACGGGEGLEVDPERERGLTRDGNGKRARHSSRSGAGAGVKAKRLAGGHANPL
jgi:hypothetical protein